MADSLRSGNRQLIAPFIFRVTGMSSDHRKPYVVFLNQRIELLPQFNVPDGQIFFAPPPSPAVSFPAGNPGTAAVRDVSAVCDDLNSGPPTETLQTFNHGHELHSVVGCVVFAAAEFLFTVTGRMAEYTGPASGTWIASTGAISEQADKRKGSIRIRHRSAPECPNHNHLCANDEERFPQSHPESTPLNQTSLQISAPAHRLSSVTGGGRP